ncbi:PAS domain S-box protein [soil metagenome]
MATNSGEAFFRNLIFTVFAFVVGYSCLFGLLGAYFSAVLILSSGILLTPITLLLEKKSYHNLARFVFIASAVLYVYSYPLGVRVPASSEYYYIPAMMIALLLFDPKQTAQIASGMFIPLIGWLLTSFGPLPDLPATWMPTNFPGEVFRILNFLGAFLITALFLRQYGRHLRSLQEQVSQELSHVTAIAIRLDESQEKAKLGSWDWDLKTNVLIWSRQQYNLFGRDPSLGMDFATYFSFLSPGSKIAMKQLVERAMKGDSPCIAENEIVMPDGSSKLILETGHVDFDEQGQPLRMSGTSQDVTERKKIENALKRSSNLLEASQSIAKLGGWDLDLVTGELFWTAESYRIIDTSPADFIPTLDSVLGHFLPESRKIVSEALRVATEEGLGFDLPLEVLTTKGRKITVRTTCEAVLQDGRTVKLRGIFQDISEQKAVTEELDRTRERLEIAVDAVQFGIWDWNIKAGTLTWDDNMYRIYDVKKDDFHGDYDAFEKTLIPADAVALDRDLKVLFAKQGRHFESEFRIRSGSAAIKYINITARCFYDSNGQIERLVGANWDTTAKKISEAALIASSKMASLGEMAGGVAHEINNPLAIIQGKAEMLKRHVGQVPMDIDKIRSELNKIESTTSRIAKVIKGLLTFSRDGVGDPMIAVQVSQIVEDTLELCRERFKNHEIDVRARCANDVGIECRPSQISQVLMNLLSNAYDAVETMSERWVAVDVSLHEQMVRIVVTDSGRGISKEIVDKIMQPFFTTKAVGKGTGLGLSISKGIIEDHHGRLTYDAASENTRFVLDLPQRQP